MIFEGRRARRRREEHRFDGALVRLICLSDDGNASLEVGRPSGGVGAAAAIEQ